jgi:hypothetical protein
MNKKSSFLPFVTGAILGVLAAVYLPGYVRPYLPDWLPGKETVVTGTVMAKQRKDQQLFLAVDTKQGAVLITITIRTDETDLLVEPGNTLEFTLAAYRPFVNDPRITRVIKSEQASSPEPAKAAAPEARPPQGDKGSREAKPQRQTTSGPAGAASKTTPSAKPPSVK